MFGWTIVISTRMIKCVLLLLKFLQKVNLIDVCPKVQSLKSFAVKIPATLSTSASVHLSLIQVRLTRRKEADSWFQQQHWKFEMSTEVWKH